MDEAKLDRANEIYFLAICTRVYNFRNSTDDIITYIKQSFTFIEDVSVSPIIELAKEIFHRKYLPDAKELALVLYKEGHSTKEISKLFHKTQDCIVKWFQKDIVLYPRATKFQLRELDKYITQYKQLWDINLKILI